MAVPSLIQHLAGGLVTTAGDGFTYTLPNPVGAGNGLILGVAYPSGTTLTITDNAGNTWPGTAAVVADAGAGNIALAGYVLPNTIAAITTLKISTGSIATPISILKCSEFFNIATTSPVSGTSSAASQTGPTISAGSFTPPNNNANGGNLVWAMCFPSSGSSSNTSTGFTAGSGFTLLDADIGWLAADHANFGAISASEYFVQATSAAINPGFNTGASTDVFNCIALSLTAAAAGTPKPAGIHIDRLLHFSTQNFPATGTYKLQCPATGNLRVLACQRGHGAGELPMALTGVTDTDATYTLNSTVINSQFWVAQNTPADTNSNIASIVASGNTQTASVSWRFYDISGAASSSAIGAAVDLPQASSSAATTAAANASTATSSAILHFASVPAAVAVGMFAFDTSKPTAITGGQKVISKTSTTVTLDQNVNASVASGNTISFGFVVQDAPIITPTGSNNLILVNLQNLAGPVNGFYAGATNPTPAAAIFDYIGYIAETDNDTADNADAGAHYFNPNTTAVHFNFVAGPTSSANLAGGAIEIKAGTATTPAGFDYTPFDRPTWRPGAQRDFQSFVLPAQPTTLSQTGIGFFSPFDPAPKPINHARDWIEFYQKTTPNPTIAYPFSVFDPARQPKNLSRDFQLFVNAPGNPNQVFGSGHDWWPRAPKPPYLAVDWITQFGNISVDTLPINPIPFTPFDPARVSPNFARDWVANLENIPIPNPVVTVVFGGFTPFDPVPKPRNFALDWIANFETPPPAVVIITVGDFLPFDPAPKPRNLDTARLGFQTFINAPGNPNQVFGSGHDWWPRAAKPPYYAVDWTTQFGNISVDTLPIDPTPFSLLDPAPKPRNLDAARLNFQSFINAPGNPNQFFGSGHDWWPRSPRPPFYATDWIANLIPTQAPFNPMPFSQFAPAQSPRNFSSGWTAYDPSNQFFTPTPTTSTMFMQFSDGMRSKLWTRSGQQPQWWTYSFISPPSPKPTPKRRDTHDGDWIRKRHKKPQHPPVYSAEYYEKLRKEQRGEIEPKAQPPLLIPTLLIPLDQLISPIDVPSLKIDIPSLRTPVPEQEPVPEPIPVQARTPRQDIGNAVRQFAETIDKFAEAALTISQALLSEIESDQHQLEAPQKTVAPTPLARAENIMQKFADGIDQLYKAGLAKKRIIYDLDGRPIGVEPIPDDEDDK